MANTYKALQTVTVGAGGASSVSFTNIPQTYTDLVIALSVDIATTSSFSYMQFNDSAVSYTSRNLFNQGTTNTSPIYTLQGGISWNGNSAYPANTFSNSNIHIPNYTSANQKSWSADYATSGTSTTSNFLVLEAGLWAVANPITKITFIPSSSSTYVEHSTFTLYGVFNADVSSAPATPTIGTATVASPTSASITFTGVSNAASYTMTSTPSSITGTGTTSPIVVSGLTTGTSYTFKVKSNNPFGSSAESAASNSVTPSTAYESIATTSVGAGGASSVVFSGIPSDYTHLQIRFIARNTTATTDAAGINLQINGDTGNNYNTHYIFGSGAAGSTPWTEISTIGTSSITNLGASAGANATNCVGMGVIDIVEYANTNKLKTLRAFGGTSFSSGNPDTPNRAGFGSGLWRSTSAITSLTFTTNNNFAQYTHFALYGIRS